MCLWVFVIVSCIWTRPRRELIVFNAGRSVSVCTLQSAHSTGRDVFEDLIQRLHAVSLYIPTEGIANLVELNRDKRHDCVEQFYFILFNIRMKKQILKKKKKLSKIILKQF